MTAVIEAETPIRVRSRGIDALRGLAILLMIGDHLALLIGNDVYRYTAGRLAMPLFFVLAGYLVSRLTWRHAAIAVVGVRLPYAVSWVDRPNVLVLYAVGATFLVWGARWPWLRWVYVVAAVAWLANGYDLWHYPGYHPLGMLALMAVGSLMRSGGSSFAWADRFPEALRMVGRFPLSWYVGHLLLIEGTRLVVLAVRNG